MWTEIALTSAESEVQGYQDISHFVKCFGVLFLSEVHVVYLFKIFF